MDGGGVIGNVDKIVTKPRTVTKAVVKTKNSFQALETISETESNVDLLPGQSTESKVLQDQSWPKIGERKPSTSKRQPTQVAPKVPRVRNRREWKPLDLEGIQEVKFVAPVEKRKSTSVCQLTFHVTDASKNLASGIE